LSVAGVVEAVRERLAVMSPATVGVEGVAG